VSAASFKSVAVIQTIETSTPVVKTQLDRTLDKGVTGDDVAQVQQRLTDLGFAPGPVDGVFGSGTQQAVWAYEKLILKTPRAQAKGRVSDEMWQDMQDRITIPPRRPTGAGSTHVEIYVPEEVLIVFKDDAPELIAHISTGEQNPDGTPKKWCDTLTYDTGPNGEPLTEPVTKQECADAKTPGGVFRFTRRYDGKRTGPLGGMMNPVYFNYGIAVHGAYNVPLEPASHGCIRIPNLISPTFFGLVNIGEQVFVFDDVKEPEVYGSPSGLWDWKDPNYTTTTTSTTTTTTTTVPQVVVPPAPVVTPSPATTPPVTTTTTPPPPPATNPPG
jgi:peptidoglycan hydrolase-like protein with peptidoglycan-binding domain